MTLLEFFATVFNLLGVVLMIKKNIWTWPIGLVGVVLLGILFYRIQLYSDFIEQIYFFITGIYGWILWRANKNKKTQTSLPVSSLNNNRRILILLLFGITSFILSTIDKNLSIYFPSFFPYPASYPYWDSSTTAAAFIANLLNVHRKLEAWIFWIYVNVVGIVLYIIKDVYLIAGLYFVFFILALKGYSEWKKT